MAGEYKAPCGCKIHVAQWTTKRKIVTQQSCSLHKAASDMLYALKVLLPKGWDTGTMDHIPGVRLARLAIAKATGIEKIELEDSLDTSRVEHSRENG